MLTIESFEREREVHRAASRDRDAETCHEVVQCLDAMHGSLCIALVEARPRAREQGSVEHDIYGMLCVRDERVRDAFSPEEIQLLHGLCAQVVTAIENTRSIEHEGARKLATMGDGGRLRTRSASARAIKASAEYLRETPAEDAGSDEFLHIIVEEVDRLNRVVSSFLDYANPAHGDLHMLCDVNAVVERTAQVLASEVAEVDLMAALLLAPGLPRVRIDAERLRQVLINLIQNALQAIELGGTLRIETQLSQPLADGSASWVDISVSDTGKGVPQQVLHNLFEPFVTTRQTGTGLGLAICQRIVSAASGKIIVQTRQNQGSTFNRAASCGARGGAASARRVAARKRCSGDAQRLGHEPVSPQGALGQHAGRQALLLQERGQRGIGGALAAARHVGRQDVVPAAQVLVADGVCVSDRMIDEVALGAQQRAVLLQQRDLDVQVEQPLGKRPPHPSLDLFPPVSGDAGCCQQTARQ